MSNSASSKKIFQELSLVVFTLPDEGQKRKYAINTHKVREVVMLEEYTPLPDNYRPFIGIINLRGVPIPLIDLDSTLNIKREKYSANYGDHRKYRILICEILNKYVGVIVDPLVKMVELVDSQVKAIDLNSNHRGDLLSGIVDYQGCYLFMVNLEAILDTLEEDSSSSQINNYKYKGMKALVVEDSHLFQKKLKRFLEGEGFSVVICENGLEGQAYVKENEDIDIIFADIEMPLLNGIEMVRRIRSESPSLRTPIVFHSSISNKELISQIEDEELGHYLIKFNESALTNMLNKLLD